MNHKLIKYVGINYSVRNVVKIPKSINEAFSSDHAEEWREAVSCEMNSIKENDVYDVVELPQGKKPIGVKWVFDFKKDLKGNITRFNARLVAKGFTQIFDSDYFDTFAPVACSESIRLFLVLAHERNLVVKHWDFCTAFLAGDLEENIWMSQPPGFDDGTGRVWFLKKFLYGLKQASRAWNIKLANVLNKTGFKQLITDPCFFIKHEMMIVIHVDDLLCAIPSDTIAKEIYNQLENFLKLKDLGDVKYFLGIQIERNKLGFILSQKVFIRDLLIATGMVDSKPVYSQMESLDKVLSSEFEIVTHHPYREIIGKLNYLVNSTRPDLSFL